MDNNCLMMTVKEFLERESHKYIISEENGSERIIKLPQNRKYSIPAYQREIRWKADNINILISDLRAGKKFLGTILLNKVNDTNYDIIDGQQRITTLLMILRFIQYKYGEDLNVNRDFCPLEIQSFEGFSTLYKNAFSEESAQQEIVKQTDDLNQLFRLYFSNTTSFESSMIIPLDCCKL